MLIFWPLFIILFIAVPIALTHWIGGMLRLRGVGYVVLFVFIALINWQAWQAGPRSAPATAPQPASYRG